MNTKKPIDLIRESAGQMTIGTPEEGKIEGSVNVNDRLLIVKTKAVYEMVFADQVDPKRANPAIPNTQQRVLSFGADSPLLGRTLMTASRLFNPTHLGGIECRKALELALDIAHDVSAMYSTSKRLKADESAIAEQVMGQELDPGFTIPMIENLDSQCNSFVHRADHMRAATIDVTRLFYGDQVKHADSLLEIAKKEHGENDPFVLFLKDVVPILRAVREIRNAIEHPKPDERIVFKNYNLLSDGSLNPPSIEIIHPDRSSGPDTIDNFMDKLIENLTLIFEVLLAHLCSRHAVAGQFPVTVAEFPEDKRLPKHVRFSYAIFIGDQLVPMG